MSRLRLLLVHVLFALAAFVPGSAILGAPSILIWQPPFITAESGEALLADLLVLGEDAELVSDLFAYSSDLSDHEIVMGVVGTTPDTHVIDATEGNALDSYVQNGGLLYLEGADCYNYDPEVQGGYNVRPIFGLNEGSDGSSVFNGDIVGLGDLSSFGFDFDYFGEPSFLDELNPSTSTAILRKKANQDVLGVFHSGYGDGRAVGLSCEYGGLADFPGALSEELTMRQRLLAACLQLLRSGSIPVDAEGLNGSLSFALHPAVPNPVHRGTTIRFDIPYAARARLSIYDANGRLVRQLAETEALRGSHTAHWDGRDGKGKRVASGVYFSALDVDHHSLRRKVVLLK